MSIDFKKIDKEGVLKYFNIEKYGMNGFCLKLIAAITMLIDHIAVVFVEGATTYKIMRAIGRLSFPIYAFLIVEGFYHTSDRRKYATRLAIFALISEIPYDIAFHGEFVYLGSQNIFLTLLMGLLAIWGLDVAESGRMTYPKTLCDKFGYINLQSITRVIIMIGICLLGEIMKCSYSYAGIFLILCFFIFKNSHIWKSITNAFFNIVMFGGVQSFGTFSVVPIALYNGKSGTKKCKWFFYWFYPVHLLVLSLIAYI